MGQTQMEDNSIKHLTSTPWNCHSNKKTEKVWETVTDWRRVEKKNNILNLIKGTYEVPLMKYLMVEETPNVNLFISLIPNCRWVFFTNGKPKLPLQYRQTSGNDVTSDLWFMLIHPTDLLFCESKAVTAWALRVSRQAPSYLDSYMVMHLSTT